MKFDDVVEAIWRVTELRRIAGAHVVDHRQLTNDELKAAIKKVRLQYLQKTRYERISMRSCIARRTPTCACYHRLVLVDVILDQYDFELRFGETEERVVACEQLVVNRSNEIDLVDLSCVNRKSRRYQNLDLYRFVLDVAWDSQDETSPDEVNLLRKLRGRLGITESDHRLIEAKLGKYPKRENELHTRTQINEVRKYLQSMGLLLQSAETTMRMWTLFRRNSGCHAPYFKLELRTDSYHALLEAQASSAKGAPDQRIGEIRCGA